MPNCPYDSIRYIYKCTTTFQASQLRHRKHLISFHRKRLKGMLIVAIALKGWLHFPWLAEQFPLHLFQAHFQKPPSSIGAAPTSSQAPAAQTRRGIYIISKYFTNFRLVKKGLSLAFNCSPSMRVLQPCSSG